MTHLNELIALELGWRDLRPAMANVGRGQSTGIPPGKLRTYVPNWAGDLNLTRELEGSLNLNEQERYIDYMVESRPYFNDLEVPITEEEMFRLIAHATAEQKARAWLKVKGVEV